MATAASAGSARPLRASEPLSAEELRKMHAYWRAANYLSLGQIYLYANPVLDEPLKIEQVKLAGVLCRDKSTIKPGRASSFVSPATAASPRKRPA